MLKVNNKVHRTVVATTKVVNFKQITTGTYGTYDIGNCCCYHKGSKF